LHREKTNRIIEIRGQRKKFFAVLEPGDCAIPGLTDATQPRGKMSEASPETWDARAASA
jgi:hypothetical protein